jgi:hypothetical protein
MHHDEMNLAGIREVLAGAARGCYQREVLTGCARLSGADLKGKARRWAAKYAASRESAVCAGAQAVSAHGWRLVEQRVAHGKRVLVLVSPSGEEAEVCDV